MQINKRLLKRPIRKMLNVLKARIKHLTGKTLELRITESNYDMVHEYLKTQFGDSLAFMVSKNACLNSYLVFQSSLDPTTSIPILMVDRSSRLQKPSIGQDEFFFFNSSWWMPTELRRHPDGQLVWTNSVNAPKEYTYVGNVHHIRVILGQTLDDSVSGIQTTSEFELLYPQQRKTTEEKTMDNVNDDFSIDDLDVPDVDIEYQEDDGNSDCADGACKI